MKSKDVASAILLLALVVLAIGSTDSGSRAQQDRPAAPALSTGASKRIAGSSWFGCADREQHGKLVQYAVQKDEEAFKRALAAGILAGACTMFKDGEPIYIADTAIFSGLVKVRRKGEVKEYWTNIEAVK